MITTKIFSQNYSDDLVVFHRSNFKSRNSKKYLDYIFNDNPFSKYIIDKFIVGLDENQIIGEILSIPSKYHFQGQEQECVFGCDYIVKTEYRNTPVGVILLKKLLKNNTHFAIGPNPEGISYKLHVALCEQHFSDSNIYLFPNILKPITVIKALLFKYKIIKQFTKSINFKIPEQIISKGCAFKLVTDENQISLQRGYVPKWFENETLEFDRSPEYLKWRFFRSLYKYYLYEYTTSKNSKKIDGYIVLRPVKYKKWLDVLLVVDYRYNQSNSNSVKDFIRFSKNILYKNAIGFLMISNSYQSNNKFFKKKMLKIFSYPILTNLKTVNKNTFNFITFADADADLNKNEIF